MDTAFGHASKNQTAHEQAKTRGLMARINRLEAQIERQQKRDKAARLLAARSMLKRRAPLGSDGMTRGNYRVSQVCFYSRCPGEDPHETGRAGKGRTR